MQPEQRPEDMQSFAKEHIRLMKWLIRVLALQAIFFIPVAVLILWILFQELLPHPYI